MDILGQRMCTFNILRNATQKIVPIYSSINSKSAYLPTLPPESLNIFANLIGNI